MVDDLPNFGAIFEGKNTVANRDSIRGNPNVTLGRLNSLKIERVVPVGKNFQTFLSNRPDGLPVMRLGDGVTIRDAIQGVNETFPPLRTAAHLSKIGYIFFFATCCETVPTSGYVVLPFVAKGYWGIL